MVRWSGRYPLTHLASPTPPCTRDHTASRGGWHQFAGRMVAWNHNENLSHESSDRRWLGCHRDSTKLSRQIRRHDNDQRGVQKGVHQGCARTFIRDDEQHRERIWSCAAVPPPRRMNNETPGISWGLIAYGCQLLTGNFKWQRIDASLVARSRCWPTTDVM